jgi:hypothetical protein
MEREKESSKNSTFPAVFSSIFCGVHRNVLIRSFSTVNVKKEERKTVTMED